MMSIVKSASLSVFFWCLCLSARAVEPVLVPDSHAANLDSMASYISSHSNSVEQKLWSVQNWLSANVVYDQNCVDVQTQLDETGLAQWTLSNKRGVCANFSGLFCVLANKMNVNVFAISGYAIKDEYDRHVWCALVDGDGAYIFDPTWCSGYRVKGEDTYVKQLDDKYFMVSPENVRFTHVPFDPMLQLCDHILTYDQQEKKDSMVLGMGAVFDWKDTLMKHQTMSHLDQMKAAYVRMMNNGVQNELVKQEARTLKHNIDAEVLGRIYTELLDVDTQIRDTHNWLVDLNFVSPGVERKIGQTLENVNQRLDSFLSQLDTMTDRDAVASARTFRISIKDSKQRAAKCMSLLKKKKK